MKHICFLAALLATTFYSFSQVGPYAQYPLDGNANDISTNGFNGNITGSITATTNRYGTASKASTFDSNDYITLPEDFDFQERTVIVWFNASSISTIKMIFSSDHIGTQYGQSKIFVFNDQGTPRLLIKCDQVEYTASVNVGTWYQAAFTRTASSVKIYVNGIEVFSGASPDGTHSNNGTSYATVGCDRGFIYPFDGKIDDLSIYNRALTATEIGGNFTSIKDEKNNVTTSAILFPNPATGKLFLETSQALDVTIMSVDGKQLLFEAETKSIDVSSLAAGLYIATLEDKLTKKSSSRLFVKQ